MPPGLGKKFSNSAITLWQEASFSSGAPLIHGGSSTTVKSDTPPHTSANPSPMKTHQNPPRECPAGLPRDLPRILPTSMSWMLSLASTTQMMENVGSHCCKTTQLYWVSNLGSSRNSVGDYSKRGKHREGRAVVSCSFNLREILTCIIVSY